MASKTLLLTFSGTESGKRDTKSGASKPSLEREDQYSWDLVLHTLLVLGPDGTGPSPPGKEGSLMSCGESLV